MKDSENTTYKAALSVYKLCGVGSDSIDKARVIRATIALLKDCCQGDLAIRENVQVAVETVFAKYPKDNKFDGKIIVSLTHRFDKRGFVSHPRFAVWYASCVPYIGKEGDLYFTSNPGWAYLSDDKRSVTGWDRDECFSCYYDTKPLIRTG